MSGPTTFKISEKLGPICSVSKLPIDHREVVFDFTRWLAEGERLVSVSQHGVVANPEPTCGSWALAWGCACCPGEGDELSLSQQGSFAGDALLSVGNAAQLLFGGDVPLTGFEVGNPDPLYDLWVSDVVAASIAGVGCFRVPAGGGTYTTPEGYRPIGPVTVAGLNPGQPITARGWGGAVASPGYPLQVHDTSIALDGAKATLLFGQGMPGVTYGLSFLADVAPTQRRKAIELLVCVGVPMVNIVMPTPLPPGSYQYITESTDLAVGSVGSIYVDSVLNTDLLLGLPLSPQIDDDLNIKDISNKAALHNIVISSRDGTLIDDMVEYRIAYGFGALHIKWTGTRWSIMP